MIASLLLLLIQGFCCHLNCRSCQCYSWVCARSIRLKERYLHLRRTKLNFVMFDGMEKFLQLIQKFLVPGDVVLLSAGDKVPADIRIAKAIDLKFDESILTGESTPIEKSIELINEKRIIAEQKNMALAGTFVISGKAEGVVVATGIQSYLGQIAGLVLQTEETSTPLQDQILQLSWLLSVLMVSVSTVVLAIGFWRGIELHTIISIAIALAVASVPEIAIRSSRCLRRCRPPSDSDRRSAARHRWD